MGELSLDIGPMREFVSGTIAMGYVVGALFFLRFWSRTRDRLFLVFSVAFVMLALQRVALVAFAYDPDAAVWLYAARALAFMLILWAIVDKNRKTVNG